MCPLDVSPYVSSLVSYYVAPDEGLAGEITQIIEIIGLVMEDTGVALQGLHSDCLATGRQVVAFVQQILFSNDRRWSGLARLIGNAYI